MKKITELYVIIENQPNAAGNLFRLLKKKNIAVYAVGVFQDTARLYVSDPKKTISLLHELNYVVEEREVLAVSLPNKTGALMDLTMKLGNAKVNIDYMYGALEPKQKEGTIILEVDNPNLALELFRNHSF
jgi:hypothetical protein